MSVEEARAVCRQEGGMLTVFTEQRVTQSGLGPIKESPGDAQTFPKLAVKARPEIVALGARFPWRRE